MNLTNFRRYEPAIRRGETGRTDALLMDRDGDITVHYAPFEGVNADAKLVLVGITPGPTQMTNALNSTRESLSAGMQPEEALARAKSTAAFSGDAFRNNLIRQLDHWGVNSWLGLGSCSALFHSHRHLLHSTSLLRYPVFVRGRKYEGAPNMLSSPLLRRYLHDYFVRDVCSLRSAIFIGLGSKVSAVLDVLVGQGAIEGSRVFTGLLHASPENTYRVDWLTGTRGAAAPWRTNPAAYDAGRAAFHSSMAIGAC
jgi:hypothetical protein